MVREIEDAENTPEACSKQIASYSCYREWTYKWLANQNNEIHSEPLASAKMGQVCVT